MTASDQTPFPPGARIVVRDTEWLVRNCTPDRARRLQDQGHRRVGVRPRGGRRLLHRARRPEAGPAAARGDHARPRRHPRVRDVPAVPGGDAAPHPAPAVRARPGRCPDSFLLDELTYQQRPAELALKNLRPRILLADVVGLGKTLEIGLILAELIRRGRGDRILVVTPQQVLEQFQLELWTRFAIPLIRLDSVGIERIQREIPAGRNPFTYYKRIIISVDTLKNEGRYGQHLDAMHWDAVVIDESHNLIGSGAEPPQPAGQAPRPSGPTRCCSPAPPRTTATRGRSPS